MEKTDLIFYIFIIIFLITAIITFLGITNIIKTIKARFLNALFTALILEVVAAVIITYRQLDLNCQTDAIIENLTKNLDTIDDGLSVEKKVAKLKLIIDAHQDSNIIIESLEKQLTIYEDSIEKSNADLNILDKVFYSNVIKLRIVAETIKGRTINLIWNKEEKEKVYSILGEIFIELGYVNPNDKLTNEFIIDKYIRFANDNGLIYLLKNEGDVYNQVLVDEYATTIFLRKYLNQKYPLKK